MPAYYNEHDKFAAAWLRELIRRNLIAPGDVDERSIEDVKPNELRGYTQCHFFAGIAGWSYALRLAGVADDQRVWTGSCPCQPFSAAGKGAGFADERHLWPAWLHLIAQCQPPIIFGEQVASKAALVWWDLVSADLEGAGYACAAADLCAASVGAPFAGQRLHWMAATDRYAHGQKSYKSTQQSTEQAPRRDHAGGCGSNAYASSRIVVGADQVGRACEPGIQPMANGFPAGMDQLRTYGNAICAPLAQAFIEATM